MSPRSPAVHPPSQIEWYETRRFKITCAVIILGYAIFLILNNAGHVYDTLRAFDKNSSKIILCFLNLVVLAIFYFRMLDVPELQYKTVGQDGINGANNYASVLDTMKGTVDHNETDAHTYNDRVNALARQMNATILGYMLCLMIVYPVYIVDYYYELNGGVDAHPSHHLFKIVQDIFNYLSSLFIYLAFLVLYNDTLDKKNASAFLKNNFFVTAIIVTAAYFITYAALTLFPIKEAITNSLSLFAGMFNGLAMVLLFSRYISLDFTMKKIVTVRNADWLELGIIYLLPIYAIVQPLFGTFEVDMFGDQIIFANYVFLFCLIGKSFFLYVTDLGMHRFVFHIHLHHSITPYNLPLRYEKAFRLRNMRKEAVTKYHEDILARVDMDRLTEDLERMQKSAKLQATAIEHDIEVGFITAAMLSAKKDDKIKLDLYLSAVSKWTMRLAVREKCVVAAQVINILTGK